MSCIGHEKIISFFDACISERKLSHAYVFSGPRHVGKRTIANTIARTILGISRDQALVHPDLIVVQRELDEKTETLKKDISVTQIRDLIHRLSQSAFAKDGYTVAIVDGAEHMNAAGANALLKTLEEPRARTIVFLITQDEYTLLPTIRSRTQSIYFSLVGVEKIKTYLESVGIPAGQAEEYAHEAHGLPGYACDWAHDSTLYEYHVSLKQRCVSLMHIPFYEKIKKIEEFFQDKDDHIEARARIIDMLGVWTFTLRDIMTLHSSNSESRYVVSQVLDSIRHAEKQLKQNIHPRLILEHIMLALP